MLSTLDEATRHLHADADRRWAGLLRVDVEIETYLHQLVSIHGFEAPVEAALALTPDLQRLLDLRRRARSGWIVQDLLALGLRPAKLARLPQCSRIVPFRDPAEALGWLYVVERSTRHHLRVAQNLACVLPSAPLAYLSHGQVEHRLEMLEEALGQIARDGAGRFRVISAALDAFATEHEWRLSAVRVSSPNLPLVRAANERWRLP